MKKFLICLLLIMCFLITGCSKDNKNNALKNIEKLLDKSKGYFLSGDLSIYNNDDHYNYNVDVYYKKDMYYKVVLRNESNGYTQVILKNDDGVYVLTPSLNKSFKFQSDWPNDNSQVYLLEALIKDIKSDSDYKFSFKDNKYEFITKVNYPNNSRLVSQKITFDKNYKLKKVEVYDLDEIKNMVFNVNKIDLSYKFDDNCFSIDSIIDNTEIVEETNNSIDEIIYPLYLPAGTKLVEESRMKKDNGERVIMTFDGEKSFLLVEETLDVFNEFTVIPTTGEPYQLLDTLGVMTDNSLSWTSGNIEYYLVSDVMSVSELVEVAQSLIAVPALK